MAHPAPALHRPPGRGADYATTTAAVTVTALAGARSVDPASQWYRSLDKPPWQPPSWAFGAVWTPLYASIAWAAGRALSRTTARTDQVAAAAVLPYAAWCVFATALNSSIARRNREPV